MAIQETMQALAMGARAPFLLFLERGGWLDSAVAIERLAIEARPGVSFRGCDFRWDFRQIDHPLAPRRHLSHR